MCMKLGWRVELTDQFPKSCKKQGGNGPWHLCNSRPTSFVNQIRVKELTEMHSNCLPYFHAFQTLPLLSSNLTFLSQRTKPQATTSSTTMHANLFFSFTWRIGATREKETKKNTQMGPFSQRLHHKL